MKDSWATLALIALLCAGLSAGADKRNIRAAGAEPNAGWSNGLLVDGTLYVSGPGHIEITATARK